MNQRNFIWSLILITVVAAMILIFVVPTVAEFIDGWQQQVQSHTEIK